MEIQSLNYDKMYMSDGNQDFINVNMRDNSIHFNANINPKTISQLIEKLLELESNILKVQRRLNNKIKDIKKEGEKAEKEEDDFENQMEIIIRPKPITLYITSNGGWIYQVFSAIDTIADMRVPVNTVCKGFVASAGTLLSLAGKRRFITENTYMLIHELRTAAWGKYTHFSESFENSKQLMEHIKAFYLKRTKLTSEELDEQLKKDISWNAAMCLEKGLVDEIIKY